MSGGDFLSRSEGQLLRGRGIEDRSAVVADLARVVRRHGDIGAADQLGLTTGDIGKIGARKMAISPALVVAMYGDTGRKLVAGLASIDGIDAGAARLLAIARGEKPRAVAVVPAAEPTPAPASAPVGMGAGRPDVVAFDDGWSRVDGYARQAEAQRVAAEDREAKALAVVGMSVDAARAWMGRLHARSGLTVRELAGWAGIAAPTWHNLLSGGGGQRFGGAILAGLQAVEARLNAEGRDAAPAPAAAAPAPAAAAPVAVTVADDAVLASPADRETAALAACGLTLDDARARLQGIKEASGLSWKLLGNRCWMAGSTLANLMTGAGGMRFNERMLQAMDVLRAKLVEEGLLLADGAAANPAPVAPVAVPAAKVSLDDLMTGAAWDGVIDAPVAAPAVDPVAAARRALESQHADLEQRRLRAAAEAAALGQQAQRVAMAIGALAALAA